MREKKPLALLAALLGVAIVHAQPVPIPRSGAEDTDGYMSETYWSLWNPEVQARIDADIEKNRKADASLVLPGARKGTPVRVEQVTSDFEFGASTFNFDQLGDPDQNRIYKELFGTLFNRATVGLFWRTLQLHKDTPRRFAAAEWDSAGFWNTTRMPGFQPHWRRPASDPVVDWCARRGVKVHLHPLVWGSTWQMPAWIHDYAPEAERTWLDSLENMDVFSGWPLRSDLYWKTSVEEMERRLGGYAEALSEAVDNHMRAIAAQYADRPGVVSCDVVNESAIDFAQGNLVPGSKLCRSDYGLMPGDYVRRAFRLAGDLFPGQRKCINDYVLDDRYLDEIADLRVRGCAVDVIGMQHHLMDVSSCEAIARGARIYDPESVWARMDKFSAPGLPLCISEITITSPGGGIRGEMVQAIIARNLYRIWFSIPLMSAITWWNLVDDCGLAGEPNISGLFHRDMTPKAAYYALDGLINHEWKTSLDTRAGKGGKLTFRGFKGTYRITYTDRSGQERSVEYHLQ